MAGQNAGSIYYSVDVETGALLTANKAANDALTGLQKTFDRTDASAKSFSGEMTKTASAVKAANAEITKTSSGMSALTKVVGAYLSLRTVQSLIAMSDQYGQMASRIRQTTASTAEYERVQARLLDTANKTYRPLNEAQEVYIRTSDALRSLGYNTDQVLDVTDSLSFLLVTNSASADRASSAINAYSKAIQTGKVDSDTWQSILAATPTIVDTIAAATGRTNEEIRKLGIDGKLSLQALNEGLLQSRDANEQLAAEMETSVQDAFTALTNSLTVFIGKVNESSGASSILTGAVGDLATILQDPKTIEAAQNLAAGIVTAFGTITQAATGVVDIVKWMADSIAASMHGAALDDIVRVEDEIVDTEKKLANLGNELDRWRINRVNPFASTSELEADYKKLEARLAQLKKARDDFYNRPAAGSGAGSAPAGAPSGGTRPTVAAEAVDKETEAKKKLTEAEKALKKAQEDRRKGEEANAEALRKAQEALDQTALSARDLAMRQAELALNPYATPEQISSIRNLAGALYDVNEAAKEQKRNQELLGQLVPEQGAAQNRDKTIEDLQTLNEAKLISDQQYLDLKLEAEMAYDEQIRVMEEERFARQSTANALLLESLDALGQASTQALSGLLTGASNGQEAMRALAGTILNTVIGSFVQMGTEWVKQQIVQRAATQATQAAQQTGIQAIATTQQTATATMAATTTSTAATTGSAVAGSMAPAAGLASIASFGGAAVAGLAALLATMAIAKSAGGRQYGGDVSAGGMYRVNENGRPEVFNAANGRQYMIPNSRGEVVSNYDATSGNGGGGGVIVNVHNNASGARATAQTRETEEGTIIDVVVQDLMAGGEIGQAVNRITGTQRSGT